MKRQPSITTLAKEYLAYRRTLGFKLETAGRLLLQFARYADRSGHREPLTADLAIRWAQLPRNASRAHWSRRLTIVRMFAKHRAIFEPGTQIPSHDVFGSTNHRAPPHIYTMVELRALLAAARGLPPQNGLRPHTFATLFGLLACTGLRLREALQLARSDVDWVQGLLVIRQAKFQKSRLVPLHPSALRALDAYAQRRDRAWPQAATRAFFLSQRGTPLCHATVESAFITLRTQLNWFAPDGHRAPRIHDLRHTFACRRLALWLEQGVDVEQRLLALSTYLGHADVKDTYWYLTAVPELLHGASQQFEQFTKTASGDRP